MANDPHGGKLIDLHVDPHRRRELLDASHAWPSWDLTPRQLCDLELLANGGFSPLRGFLGQRDYESVCASLRLDDGTLWPIPIVLDVTEEFAGSIEVGSSIALRDPEGVMLAALHVTDVWEPSREDEAKAVYGSTNAEHPGVAHLLHRTNPIYVGGRVEAVNHPTHYDFKHLRLSPIEVRAELAGSDRVVAFQTRNPLHRAHYELTRRAAEEVDGALLIHPVVGMTKPGDVDHYTRVRCYQALLGRYPAGKVKLSLLPLAMRMGGPREALWHAIIRKNHGATHFIIGRDHAGPGKDSTGRAFYEPYEAQQLVQEHAAELGIGVVPFEQMLYVPRDDRYYPANEVPEGVETQDISGTEQRRRLQTGEEIPEWFSFPEVVQELRRSHPPRATQGFTVFFTGLSGSGKSTIANALLSKLLEQGGRAVTLLDGDLVRKHLSSELGFSKEHRDINIRRIGYVASEITRNGGAAICAPIAPYDAVRKEVRGLVEPAGGFLLVHVATPIEVCEQRDRKGLYAKARAGIVKGFTGIDDPYEEPADAELTIDTTTISAEDAADLIIARLREEGFLA